MAGMIAGAEVRIDGQALDPGLGARLLEVRVDDNLMLPDAVLVRVADPGLQNIDASPFEIGAEIEVLLAATDSSALKSVFTGQIAAIEPEFAPGGAVLAARAYDHSHALNRTRRTCTFQNMTAGDIARKVARTAGVDTGTIGPGGGTHEFVQQNNETDWNFLWRLASAIDYEVVVVERKLHFRPAGGGGGGGQAIDLRWGENLRSFHPRVTGVQQVDEVVVRSWDPKAKRKIEATRRPGALDSAIGLGRPQVASAIGGGSLTVADRPVLSDGEAGDLARSVIAQLANAYVEGRGICKGEPRLRAGARVKLDGIGRRFGGTYTVSSTTHLYRGARGYETAFSVSGRAPRSLMDLVTPSARRPWGQSVVVGVVTQNDDPDGLGRVRVKYPALGDDTEGWWARIACPAAGKDRGLVMMPVVGEEVLLAFEHDDPRRPYVLGSLFNSKDAPGKLVHTDGSLAIGSDKEVAVGAKDNITISGKKDLKIEVDGKAALSAKGDLSVEGQKVTIKAQGPVTIEGGTEITIKAGGASVALKPGGMVQVSGSQIMLG
jgi:phage protein D